MINRNSIRQHFAKVIDEDKQVQFAGIYAIERKVLKAFDSQPEIKDLPTFAAFLKQLAQQYPKIDWSYVELMFDMSFTDVVTKLPRQTLPALEVSLSLDGQKLNIGNTRIGGEPEWAQCPQPNEEFPVCQKCSEIMAFVCQIDSLAIKQPGINAKNFGLAFGGSVYLFACLKCPETFTTFQCT